MDPYLASLILLFFLIIIALVLVKTLSTITGTATGKKQEQQEEGHYTASPGGRTGGTAVGAHEEKANSGDNVSEKGGRTTEPKPNALTQSESYQLSLAHPKLISKGVSSRFKVTIYPPDIRDLVQKKIAEDFQDEQKEHVEDTDLESGLTVKINLSSQHIEFEPTEVIKTLKEEINTTDFLGKPKDNCLPGEHFVRLAITDKDTSHEYVSTLAKAKIVDFAFDGISRPLLSKSSATVTGSAAVAMFILTFLEQIDTTYGFTAGTAATLVTATIYGRFYALYQSVRSSGNRPFNP